MVEAIEIGGHIHCNLIKNTYAIQMKWVQYTVKWLSTKAHTSGLKYVRDTYYKSTTAL